ncbi:protein of unknown function (plasmid) [Thermococcus nautili]|nr:protein of unknown function [Thermococcus nautili]
MDSSGGEALNQLFSLKSLRGWFSMRVVIALADFEYKGLTIHKGDMVSGNHFA